MSLGYRLNDGYWHTVDLAARDNLLTLTIDEEEGSPLKIVNPFTIRTGDRYFFGGESVKIELESIELSRTKNTREFVIGPVYHEVVILKSSTYLLTFKLLSFCPQGVQKPTTQ